MNRKRLLAKLAVAALIVLAAASPILLAVGENINYADINKIKAEGMQRSQVMELCSWLSDVYAPRLTGSPTAMKAAEWAVARMKEWGLSNVKIEPWVNRNGFDRGWTNDKYYVEVIAPERFPVPGTPTGWTPGTNGLVVGEVALVAATTEEELAAFKGKLSGKWVLTQTPPDVPAYWEPQARRYKADELASLEVFPAPQAEFGAPGPAQQARPAFVVNRFAAARNDFLRAEGALGTISTTPTGRYGHGLYVISGNRSADPDKTLPAIVVAAESYNRIARTLAKNIPVKIEADIENTYYPAPQVFNVVGELPGTDKASEVVMLGGHLDTWHAATGAADDGVGVAAMMEALRILKASGVKLRRTVRVGLWEGEEQGLIGSREYVAAHFASRQAPPSAPGAPAAMPQPGGGRGVMTGPIEAKADYDKLSAYFNIDNGTGALRGIYLQGNDAAGPIFREWVEPFRSMGMTTVTIRNTGGTDHQSFDAVGLPGFQFIQDELEYNGITHHTNMDTYERLQPNDVMKMATIAAGFAYLAANRDEMLPRKPLTVDLIRPAQPPARPPAARKK